jgi:thiol-disulfide isomerase/thioredoxin
VQELVLYYFSAHWCPPCRQFTPLLKDFYEEVRMNWRYSKESSVKCICTVLTILLIPLVAIRRQQRRS